MAYNRTLGHFTSSQELATQWATAQSYIVDQIVIENNIIYICDIAHTSGTFATDLSAGKWTALTTGVPVTIANGGTGQTTQTAAFDALAPTTTAGDLIVHNGTDNVRQGIGTDGQVLVADNTQPNKLKWATLQQGAKNYITYGTFENGATTGWSLFNTTLTSKIPTGSITAGAASITSFAVDSTTPIAGTYDLRVASSGALTAGQGFISDAFTIDREDQAKPLAFSFAYEAVSGTMDFSGTSNNTFAVYIYDVSGSAWIQPAGVYNLVQNSGVGIASGSFQTTATGTQYRIAVVCITATAGAVEMRFDTFQLGPQKVLAGAAISDWVSFTPTGSWAANTTYTGRWKRVGDSVQVQASLSLTGAPTATRLTINLPSGLVIDNTKRSGGASATINNIFGTGKTFDGATAVHNLTVAYESTTAVAVSYESTATAQLNNVTNTSPFTYNSGDVLDIEYTVPITGWSSNTVLSQDTDTRVVAARYGVSGARTPTTIKAVNYDSKIFDTHGAVTTVSGDVAGWKFTAPVSGFYEVSITSAVTSGATTNSIFIYLNGVQNIALSTVNDLNLHSGSGVLEMKSGEYIDIRSDGTPTLNGNAVFNSISIRRLSGPATIASSETVAARYKTSAGNSITNAAVNYLDFVDKEYDTHGMVSIASPAGNKLVQGTGWKATIPISGKYHISAQILSQSGASWNAAEIWEIFIIKNGAEIAVNGSYSQATHTTLMPAAISSIISLNAGDIIEIAGYQNSNSGPSINMFANGKNNFVQIYRVGN